jgi:hypothetical protein
MKKKLSPLVIALLIMSLSIPMVIHAKPPEGTGKPSGKGKPETVSLNLKFLGDLTGETEAVCQIVEKRLTSARANERHVSHYILTLVGFSDGLLNGEPYSFDGPYTGKDLEIKLTWESDSSGTIAFGFWFDVQEEKVYSCKLTGTGQFTFNDNTYNVELDNAEILRRKEKGEDNPREKYEKCWSGTTSFSFST